MVRARSHGHIVNEVAVGFANLQPDSLVVDGVHLDHATVRHVTAGIGVVDLTLNIEDHRIGIPGRSVMEHHIVA